MVELRKQRAVQIAGPLREGHRALVSWHDKSLARLEQQRLSATKGGKIPIPTRRRIEQDEKTVKATFAERERWIAGLKTVQEPYLRLAAVFARTELG